MKNIQSWQKSKCKKYLKNPKTEINMPYYEILKFENCVIELLEAYECNNKKELNKRKIYEK